MGFNQSAVGQTFGPFEWRYGAKELGLYALGVGAGREELDLLLESRGPKALPSFSVVVGYPALMNALMALGGNLLTLVHGSQKCVMLRPIPSEGTLATTCVITGLYDKGKGALGVYETRTVDAQGNLIFTTEWQIFYRGEGGFGGERGPDAPAYPLPDRAPDHVLEMATAPTQALLYALNGDKNPIHVDPAVAQKAGFAQPILHGLCTFGYSTRAAVLALTGGDPDKLTHVEGRFTKPVFPGETIVTELWRVGEGEAYSVTKVKERNEVVINLGRVLYKV